MTRGRSLLIISDRVGEIVVGLFPGTKMSNYKNSHDYTPPNVPVPQAVIPQPRAEWWKALRETSSSI